MSNKDFDIYDYNCITGTQFQPYGGKEDCDITIECREKIDTLKSKLAQRDEKLATTECYWRQEILREQHKSDKLRTRNAELERQLLDQDGAISEQANTIAKLQATVERLDGVVGAASKFIHAESHDDCKFAYCALEWVVESFEIHSQSE